MGKVVPMRVLGMVNILLSFCGLRENERNNGGVQSRSRRVGSRPPYSLARTRVQVGNALWFSQLKLLA